MIINLDQNIVSNLTKTELDVVKFINNNESKLFKLSIVDIAFDTYSSPATVSRAIRKCGINGFNELRYKSTLSNHDSEIQNVGEIINKSLIEAQRVIEQISIIKVLEIIKTLKESKRIYVFARGMSEYVAQEFTFKLQLLDFNAIIITDPNIMKKRTEIIDKNECVFIFSLNGRTEELLQSARNANIQGAKVISCCCNEASPLIEISDYNVIGYRHAHTAISNYEVTSRVALNMIARIIVDYIAIY